MTLLPSGPGTQAVLPRNVPGTLPQACPTGDHWLQGALVQGLSVPSVEQGHQQSWQHLGQHRAGLGGGAGASITAQLPARLPAPGD